ncbi:hypothetical protein VPH35_078441 [Triticum aestivum]|uniref:V-SNARE coiled-coil homology domain-containing protein n=1 Tax=Triticum aestivum TaxID=4565 RepID=A0A3B6JL45_WHEAT|nr:uncharacterized protein LOC123097783 [Triticum aestivum]
MASTDDPKNEPSSSWSIFNWNNKVEPEVEQPRMRSTQEILTKYKFNGDAAAAAAHAKDKLMERQEKLAKMVEESAEFESEAENFATLGQQIRKSLETKRWWWPS